MNARAPRIPRFAARAQAQQQFRLRLRVWARRPALRRAAVASVVVHLVFVAVLILANLQWQQRHQANAPAPAEVEMVWRGGAPEMPGQNVPDRPADAFAPPGDEALPVPPPASAPPPAPASPAPEAAPPPLPPPAAPSPTGELPPPPPPAPPQPRRQQAQPAPPRQVQPQQQSFPQLDYVPGPFTAGPPAPPLPSGRPGERSERDQAGIPGRGRLDANPSSDLQASRNLGPDWRNQFRRWVDDNKRYPTNAVAMGHQGPVTVRILVGLDGRVRTVSMVGPNDSPFLNSNLMNMFRNAQLPPLPPGADPAGETITFTMRYILY